MHYVQLFWSLAPSWMRRTLIFELVFFGFYLILPGLLPGVTRG